MSSADGSPVVVKVGARDAISNLVRLLLTISQELEKRHSEAELLLRATRSVNAGATMPEMLDSVYEAFRQVTKKASVIPEDTRLATEPAEIRGPDEPDTSTPKDRARKAGDALLGLNDYVFLACVCGNRIKVPPEAQFAKIKCPTCGTQHNVGG